MFVANIKPPRFAPGAGEGRERGAKMFVANINPPRFAHAGRKRTAEWLRDRNDMIVRLTALLVFAALAAPSSAHAADVVLFVCGKDLCRTSASGQGTSRITRNGSAAAYSRPSISTRGRRVAFLRGRRGRAYTARLTSRGLAGVRRIGPAPDGPRDATQFDIAIAADGRRVVWTELRINVVFNSIDYRRYMARFDGSEVRQVAASGGRPFAAFFDTTRILREGLTDAVQERPAATTVDQGLCVPDPESAQNGTCGNTGPQAAFDPTGRHLRHPHVHTARGLLVATAYPSSEGIDSATDGRGQIVLFSLVSALPLRDLTRGAADAYPSFSPDGRRVAFDRGGSIFTVPTAGGTARRLASGRQPTWGR
jgi:Tol biopolymer transport system component